MKQLAPEFGQKLRQAREDLKLSLTDVHRETKIKPAYLHAFEDGLVPSGINQNYALSLLRSYASFLGFDKATINQYLKHNPVKEPGSMGKHRRRLVIKRDVITSRLAVLSGLSVLMIGIMAYVVLQVVILSSAPPLDITQPSSDIVVTQPTYTIEGKSTPGAEIAINGVAILSNPDGSFTEDIVLRTGLNNLSISSTNKLGKSQVIDRAIIYNDSPLDEQKL